ncbi:ABC transporter ATP-binding protein [Pseudolabrys sp. FHR47]|uniref:ABC transporter ATP-binding protein n=1 Tax=Pseudolabrys sp. FHR47 TaxID=2562284 RepID=UPI0010BF271E|nr:ABC transporter ATP-binding protein [Pseudolabrys sp. FHR47]
MSEPPVISFDNVEQVFVDDKGASVVALKNLSLSVGRHEFIAILGPSGCGKSTLLRQLAGLIKPTRGTVSIYGMPVTQPRDDTGIVFQRPTLLPWFDVLGNVTFVARHKYGRVTAEDKERAHELLKLVDLDSFAGARIDQLSGGMQQRVAIARALLLDPDILLMDEPFSALDALARDEMSFELLRIWTERPKTVVFITHSIPEAVLLADRIVVMTPRPGTVREILTVPLPRPRSLETLSDPRFNELANHIRSQLFTRRAA